MLLCVGASERSFVCFNHRHDVLVVHCSFFTIRILPVRSSEFRNAYANQGRVWDKYADEMRWTVVRRHHAYTLRIISMLCVCVLFLFLSNCTWAHHERTSILFNTLWLPFAHLPIPLISREKKMRRKQIPRAIISNREIVICATEKKKTKLNRNRNTKHAEIKAKIIDGTYCELVFKGLKCAIIHSWFKLSQSICRKKHVKQE